MSPTLDDYRDAYRNVAFERRDGVLLVRLHSDGGPLRWEEAAHRELPLAFHDIGADRDNHVVILTGTGDVFCEELAWETWPPIGTAETQDKILREARQLLGRLLDIDVPIIGVVNGPARIHAELVLLSDVVLAADTACFQDAVHFQTGGVPGDGVQVLWPLWLGANRGRSFLLMGDELGAREAQELGVVREVLPADRVMDRAWEIAERFMQRPPMALRYTRMSLTAGLKRVLAADMPEGLAVQMFNHVAAMSEGAPRYPVIRDGH